MELSCPIGDFAKVWKIKNFNRNLLIFDQVYKSKTIDHAFHFIVSFVFKFLINTSISDEVEF